MVTLTFYYQIRSEDECGYDTATVSVESVPNLAASGSPDALAVKSVDFDLCQGNSTGTWEQATVDLSEFANEMVRLKFVAKTDESLRSSLFVDDATLTVATGAAPSPTPPGLPQGTDFVYLPVAER